MDTITCSWLVSQNATQLAGSLAFALRFVCANEYGEIIYQWSTGIYSNLSIVQSINNVDSVTGDVDSTDLLAQWKAEILKSMNPYIEESRKNADMSSQSADQAKLSEDNAKNSAAIAEDNKAQTATLLAEAKVSEKNAANSSLVAASSSQAAAISAQAAATSAENAQQSEYRTDSIHNASIAKLREATELMAEVENKMAESTFAINFLTGNLEYTSPNYTFAINTATGKLEWEVL